MTTLKRTERLVSGWGARKASQRLPAKINAWKCRRVLEGYPIDVPFGSVEAIRDYLHGERIVCLRCGKSYKALARHLQVHSWTPEQYRKHYNLPRYQGLTCEGVKTVLSDRANSLYAAGVWAGSAEKAAHARSKRTPGDYEKTPLAKMHANQNITKMARAQRRIKAKGAEGRWTDADYFRVPNLMVEHDLTMKEVCAQYPVPAQWTIRARAIIDKVLFDALEVAWEGLSFRAQARGQCLGKRFMERLMSLHEAGRTQLQIANELGVTQSLVSGKLRGKIGLRRR